MGKSDRVKSRGTMFKLSSVPSHWSHTGHLILPETMWATKLPTRDIHLSLGVQGFYWVLVIQAYSTCVGDPPQLPKFQTSRRLEFTMNHTAGINYLTLIEHG